MISELRIHLSRAILTVVFVITDVLPDMLPMDMVNTGVRQGNRQHDV